MMSVRLVRAESPAVQRERSEVVRITGVPDVKIKSSEQTGVEHRGYDGGMLCRGYGGRVSAECDRVGL